MKEIINKMNNHKVALICNSNSAISIAEINRTY